MKRRTVFMVVGVVLLGILAYFGGYYYMHEKPQIKIEETMMQRNLLLSGEGNSEIQAEYYVAKIEETMLNIYKMPENMLYDAVKLSSLQLSEEEQERLRAGITFQGLTEVFEFLENSMS